MRQRFADETAKTRRSHLHLKRKYGMTVDDLDAMWDRQDGCCALCGDPVIDWVIDHCHTSGKVRGILHHKCNVILGMAQDDPALLRRAAEYLEVHA